MRTEEPPTSRSGADLAVFGVVLGLLLVLSAVAPIGSVISMMVVASCQGRCDHAVMQGGQLLYAAGPASVLVASAIVGAVVRRRGRLIWWVPVVGLAVALCVVQAGHLLILSGVPAR